VSTPWSRRRPPSGCSWNCSSRADAAGRARRPGTSRTPRNSETSPGRRAFPGVSGHDPGAAFLGGAPDERVRPLALGVAVLVAGDGDEPQPPHGIAVDRQPGQRGALRARQTARILEEEHTLPLRVAAAERERAGLVVPLHDVP